jgi:hypothetical protein
MSKFISRSADCASAAAALRDRVESPEMRLQRLRRDRPRQSLRPRSSGARVRFLAVSGRQRDGHGQHRTETGDESEATQVSPSYDAASDARLSLSA